MPNYRFIGLTPRFYPDERGEDGKSLMAVLDLVHDWEHTPEDGLWVLVSDGGPGFPAVPAPDPAPEPAQEAPVVAPVPEAAPADPEPPVPPVAAPEATPEPEPVQAALTADWFSALSTPPARA